MVNKYLQKIKNFLEEDKVYKIAFLGDSITSSEDIRPNYVDIINYILKEELTKITGNWELPYWKLKIINSGLNGATSKLLLDTLKENILDYNPHLAIAMVGKNDPYLGISSKSFSRNIEKVLSRMKTKNIDIVICSPNASLRTSFNEKIEPYLKEIKYVSNKLRILYVDIFKEFQAFNLKQLFTVISPGNKELGIGRWETDPIHPNTLGHARIAQVILEKVFKIKFNIKKFFKDLEKMNAFYRY